MFNRELFMIQHINDELLTQARSLTTAEISDALDFFDLPGSALGIGHIAGGTIIFGRAFTVKYGPVCIDNPGTVGDYPDQVQPGDVIVLDNAGRLDCTVWGGILSQMGAHRGFGGTVINGVCRDTAEADEAGYPLFARGRFMRTGKDRVQVEATQIPVSLGDVRVRPGDIIVGDKDGIVVVPATHADKVFAKALATQAAEVKIVASILSGDSLAEARKKNSYHTLQRGDEK